jgi:epoxyqueuosine reductase
VLDLAQAAREAGFDRHGVVSLAQPMPELDFFPGWLDRGSAGEMHYLASRDDKGQLKRASVRDTFPWAKTAIVCALNYNTAQPYSTECDDPTRGWISRYAWFPHTDYHTALMSRLEHLESAITTSYLEAQTRRYVDTGPLLERVLAKYAGLGWLAKNTCVINEELGSWFFLGVILTSVQLAEPHALPAADRCGTCTACLDACPTNAFPAPYQLDASRCISYLTIEKRGDIPEDLRAGIGANVFGCDICQDVCPWNSKERHSRESARVSAERAPDRASTARGTTQPRRSRSESRERCGDPRINETRVAEFVPAPELVNPPLAWLAEMSREDFQKQFRNSPIKRAKYSGLRRNAVVAIGNSGDRTFLPLLERLTQDEDPTVASHAQWSLNKLSHKGASS